MQAFLLCHPQCEKVRPCLDRPIVLQCLGDDGPVQKEGCGGRGVAPSLRGGLRSPRRLGYNLTIKLRRYLYMKGRRFGICTMGVALCLVLAWSVFAQAAGKAPYKIGVNLELTGPWAEVTKTVKMAMRMEVDKINAKGGGDGHPLERAVECNGA